MPIRRRRGLEGAMVFLSPELDGAMFGFGVMCYSNSVRRLRMMRRKFLHPPHRRGAAGKESAACVGCVFHRRPVGARRHDGGGGRARRRPVGAERVGEDQDGGAADGAAAAEPVDLATCVRPPARDSRDSRARAAPSTRSLATARAHSSLPPAVLGGYAEL